MANSIALPKPYGALSSVTISAVCQTRTDLLDRLAAILANLGLAKLQLWSSVESEDPIPYESACIEVERLRQDCTEVRAELESHRARHGC
jgi:hypothetical protein